MQDLLLCAASACSPPYIYTYNDCIIKIAARSRRTFADLTNPENIEKLRQEWNDLKTLSEEHPLMKLDPHAVTTERITFAFKKGSFGGMIYDWLQAADEDRLFGSAKESLASYKNELIYVNSGLNGTVANGTTLDGAMVDAGVTGGNEVSVGVIAIDGWDTAAALSYIKEIVNAKASAAGLNIIGTSESKWTGESTYVRSFQQSVSDRQNAIPAQIQALYQASVTVVAPPTFEETEASGTTTPATPVEPFSLKNLLKYILIGSALGLIAGAAIAIFLTLKQGRVISRRQIEDTFGLELLSDCSKADETSLAVLNANLDVMIGEGKQIMLLGSRLTDIQRVLIRAKKLGKQVVGYVLV